MGYRIDLGGQGRCVRRIEVFVKTQKKLGGQRGGPGEGGGGLGEQGGCERRIEVFGKNSKNKSGGGVGFGGFGLGGQGGCE